MLWRFFEIVLLSRESKVAGGGPQKEFARARRGTFGSDILAVKKLPN
jgi:hypothetical protein